MATEEKIDRKRFQNEKEHDLFFGGMMYEKERDGMFALRERLAKDLGINKPPSIYDPLRDDWRPELAETERKMKLTSKFNLFSFYPPKEFQGSGIASMVETMGMLANEKDRKKLVLSIEDVSKMVLPETDPRHAESKEMVGEFLNFVKRSGVPVHKSKESAMAYALGMSQNPPIDVSSKIDLVDPAEIDSQLKSIQWKPGRKLDPMTNPMAYTIQKVAEQARGAKPWKPPNFDAMTQEQRNQLTPKQLHPPEFHPVIDYLNDGGNRATWDRVKKILKSKDTDAIASIPAADRAVFEKYGDAQRALEYVSNASYRIDANPHDGKLRGLQTRNLATYNPPATKRGSRARSALGGRPATSTPSGTATRKDRFTFASHRHRGRPPSAFSPSGKRPEAFGTPAELYDAEKKIQAEGRVAARKTYAGRMIKDGMNGTEGPERLGSPKTARQVKSIKFEPPRAPMGPL